MIAYYLLRDGGVYREIGDDYYDRLHPERTIRRLTQRLERIGYDVVLTARAKAAPHPPKARRRHGRPRRTSAPSAYCSRCAKWDIACIHARNALALPTAPSCATESTG